MSSPEIQEPEDERFVFRWWADLQFLIVALRRMRRAAQIAERAPSVAQGTATAIRAFDDALPGLATMRNVGEHVDAYAVDDPRRHNRKIDGGMLQVGTWDGTTYRWLDLELNIDAAHAAAEQLYRAMRGLVRASVAPSK